MRDSLLHLSKMLGTSGYLQLRFFLGQRACHLIIGPRSAENSIIVGPVSRSLGPLPACCWCLSDLSLQNKRMELY